MKLWFEDANGNERVIAEANTWDEVHQEIKKFIDECNARKNGVRPFVCRYSNIYTREDGRTCIDVGSHVEFFIWEGKYECQ